MKNWLIPHPNVPNTEFGDAHLKRVTTLFNENFAKLDALMQTEQASVASLESSKSNDGHNHDEEYAQLEHKHVPDDVTGLSDLLDNKANLNHEHAQYLTEITAHQHETNEINGLLEALNGKAPTAHGHTFADVDGLDDLSANAARVSYVDRRDAEKLAAAKAYTDAAISGIDVPSASSLTPYKDTEDGATGTATSFARGDHQHPLNYPTGKPTTDMRRDGAGNGGAASFGTTNSYADLGHSHPLDVPTSQREIELAKQAIALTMDGMGTDTENGAALGATPFYARLDHIHALNVDTVAPPDISTSSGSVGNSGKYAQSNHTHKMPALTGDDIAYTSTTTVGAQIQANVQSITTNTEELLNHEGRIAALEDAPSAPVTSVNGEIGDVVLDATDVGAIADDQIGVSGGVQAYSDVLKAVANGGCFGTTKGEHEITGEAHYVTATSDKARILGVAANATAVSMRDAIGTDMVAYDGTNTLDDVIGADGIIDGETNVAVGSSADKWVKTTTGGLLAVSDESVATYDAENPPSAPSIVSMDAVGVLTDECAIPTSAPSSDKVLTVKSGGTALSWEDGVTMGTATTPDAQSGANIAQDSNGDAYLNPSGVTAASLNLTPSTWTRGQTDGAGNRVGTKLTVCTGIRKNPTSAVYYAHFANLSFDENGMLCKVETIQNFYRV